jgi:hypothetical protein
MVCLALFSFSSSQLTSYVGSEAERIDLATSIIEGPDEVNVVITTYSFAEKPHDQKFLRRLQSNVRARSIIISVHRR